MSKQWQIRRGTTAENNEFTGAIGEITMDTDKNQIRLHDGVTQGGIPFGDTVVEWQLPTAANNYTWYRKYASGWVEQGGYISTAFPESTTVTLVVAMADTHYNVNAIAYYGTGNQDGVNVYIYNVTTSSIGISNKMYGGNKTINCYWQVSGMAAQ